MFTYILKRIFLGLISIFALLIFVFVLMELSGKMPFSRIDFKTEEEYLQRLKETNLDKEAFWRFFNYIKNVFTFDFGIIYNPIGGASSVPSLFFEPLKYTITITSISFFLSVFTGISLGYIAGYNSGKIIDNFISFIVVIFMAIPGFVIASIFLIIGPWVNLKTSFLNPSVFGINNFFESILAPIIVLSLASISTFTYYTRNEIKTILVSEYITNARSKGLSNWKIFSRYVFRNSLIPIISIVIPYFVILLGGSIIIETFFSVPGISVVIVSAIKNNETNIVMFNAMFFGGISIFLRILIDVLYVFINPTIKYSTSKMGNYGIKNRIIRFWKRGNNG